jgi:hypothetical protein
MLSHSPYMPCFTTTYSVASIARRFTVLWLGSALPAICVIAGDLNAKLGSSAQEGEDSYIMGKYGKGNRNVNGNHLATFLTEIQYIATNTTFKQSLWRRITRSDDIGQKMRYSMIGYILIPQVLRRLLVNSHGYREFAYTSDHYPVITTLNLSAYYRPFRPKCAVRKLDYSPITKFIPIVTDDGHIVSKPGPVQIEYQNKLEEKITAANLQPIDNFNTINTTLKTIMNEEAHDILEYKQPISKPTLFLKNKTIRSLLTQLKQVMTRMHRKRGYSAAR